MIAVLSLALALLPVLAFLVALSVSDSFQLVSRRNTMVLIGVGAACAFAALAVNSVTVRVFEIDPISLRRYVAPLAEELLKGCVIAAMFYRHRIAFLVEGAVCGFAVGAGFAMIENLHYFLVLDDHHPALWVLRGFGTAVMHGGATALMAVLSRLIADRRGEIGLTAFLPGLAAATFVHSLYNHFLLSPMVSALVLLVTLPLVFVAIFRISERATRQWLGAGFDGDAELLRVLRSGKLSETRVGAYLQTLKDRFPGEVLADMLCIVRLRLELSVQAKGILLARQAGFDTSPDEHTGARLTELRHLEETIGITAVRALEPIFGWSSRDLWQFYLVSDSATGSLGRNAVGNTAAKRWHLRSRARGS